MAIPPIDLTVPIRPFNANVRFFRIMPLQTNTWALAHGEKWAELSELLKIHGKAIVPKRRKYLADASAKLPFLSYLLWLRAPKDVVRQVIMSDEEELSKQDSLNRNPLHIACMKNASPFTVEYISVAQPKVIGDIDKCGHLPLHYAVYAATACAEDQQRDCLETISTLITRYPTSIGVASPIGETPVDIAKRMDKSPRSPVYRLLWQSSLNHFKIGKVEDYCPTEVTVDTSNSDESSSCLDVSLRSYEREKPPRRNAITMPPILMKL